MKELIGTVVSIKMKKTAVVRVNRLGRHPIYRKLVKQSKKFFTHDEIGVSEGDKVKIRQSRPISRNKKWRIVEIIR